MDNKDMPEFFQQPEFMGNSVRVKKLEMLPVECIVRGYITGSGWNSYKENGTVCGYIGAQSVPPEADVMNLAVAPDCRRQGIARQLLSRLTKLLHRQGIEALFLEVRPSNHAAIALYEAFGFVQIGRRPKYYVNPSEDALILRKEL